MSNLPLRLLILLMLLVSHPLCATGDVSNLVDAKTVYSRFIEPPLEGFVLPVATTMTRDPKGFLWLGTQHGLIRHDGNDFKLFRADPGKTGSLSASWISALTSDQQNGLWVGTRFGGLNYFDPATETFSYLALPQNGEQPLTAEITALVFDSTAVLWVATYGAGLFQVIDKQLQPVSIKIDEPDTFLATQFINDVFIDAEGGTWVAIGDAPIRTLGQLNGGILYRAPAQTDWQVIPVGEPGLAVSITKIRAQADGQIFATSYGQGLYYFEPISQQFVQMQQPELLKRALLSDVVFEADGSMWVSSYSADRSGGLWRYDQHGQWQHYPYSAEFSEGLPRSDLLGLYLDQQGILWTISQAGFRGLSRFAKVIYTLPPGQLQPDLLPAPNVLGVHAVSEHSVWLANREGGVLHFNPQTSELTHWPLPQAGANISSVQTVRQDNQGILWVATDKGLYQLDPVTSIWQLFSLSARDEPMVRILFLDNLQQLWVGTRGQGLYRINAERDQIYHYQAANNVNAVLTFEDVNNLTQDRFGAIWIGSTDRGLARLDPSSGQIDYWAQQGNRQNGLQFNGIQLILEDAGHLWVRAGNINHRAIRDHDNPSKILGFKAYLNENERDTPLEQAHVFRLLYRLHWLPEQQSYLELDERHGMQSVTWIGAWDRFNQTIFRGGARGLDYFDIDTLPDRVGQMAVQLTGLSLFNQPIAPGSAILPKALSALSLLSLDYQQDMFSIHFAAPEFKQPRLIEYRYQLIGFDRDWIQTRAQSAVATYTRLPPGHYIFQVSARLPGSVWQDPTQFNIHIQPPWWLSWWFKLLAVLSLVLSITLFIRWKLQREYTVRRRLEQLVAQRTDQLEQQNQALELSYQQLQQTQQQLITQEKMASLGGLVAGVAHEINTPLGICVTATSLLQNEHEKLALAFANKSMQQSQFTHFMAQLQEGLAILQSNTQRAADLVSSFKQVSVDQSTDSYRDFDLHQYLQDVFLSLRSRLKQQRCEVVLECPQPLPMFSDPGAIAQVITNLVMNSLMHGLEQVTSPAIRLQVLPQEDQLLMLFSDNGRGMTSEELKRLFEPFFTTKRNQGGSGLGAHIVFNLVTVRLQGKVEVSSQPNEGLHYRIVLPRQVRA